MYLSDSSSWIAVIWLISRLPIQRRESLRLCSVYTILHSIRLDSVRYYLFLDSYGIQMPVLWSIEIQCVLVKATTLQLNPIWTVNIYYHWQVIWRYWIRVLKPNVGLEHHSISLWRHTLYSLCKSHSWTILFKGHDYCSISSLSLIPKIQSNGVFDSPLVWSLYAQLSLVDIKLPLKNFV